MKKRVIINYANGGWYPLGQERLYKSLINNTSSDILFFQDNTLFNSPSHNDNPYAFKVHLFNKAIEMGYEHILYVDASAYAIKNIDSIFDIINDNGYIMQYAGYKCGTWANDKCLEYFNITRDDAMQMEMYGNGGFLGLNMLNKTSIIFLQEWNKSMQHGCFKGQWNNDNKSESQDIRCKGHRHDMVCGSIIANKLNMNYVSAMDYFQYTNGTNYIPHNDTVCFFCEGM